MAAGTKISNTKHPKMLVVCQHFWPENFRLNDIADFFVEQGTEIEVLCGIPNYPKGTFFEGYSYFRKRREVHNGIKIRRTFEIPRGNNSYGSIFLNYVSFPLASLFHVPRLLFGHYDRILIYQLSPVMMSVAGILVGKLTRTQTTMYVLDLWPENLLSVLHFKNRFLKRIISSVSHWHYRNVDKLVVLSEKMKDRLVEVTGISPDKVLVTPQACEKVYEQEIHDQELATKFKDGFNIVFAGNISPAQSFETFIEAAQRFKTEGIADIHWIIVGDGMSRRSIEQQVTEAGLEANFYFEGSKPMEEIPHYTGIADLLVGCLVKSDLLEATIPAKVMSYVAAGKPIVLAMDGEAQSLINDTIHCGYAGPAGDANAFYANVKKVYKLKRKEREALGSRARKYHFKYLERSIALRKLYDFIFE